ncbi:hypothetical protein GCM10023232_15430 [Sphingosinicella ginsenosidimutans]
MSYPQVLARASGGQPLVRLAIEVENRLAYLLNPDRVEAMRDGKVDPVGFPCNDVFELDDTLAAELAGAWERGDGQMLRGLWSKARPYRDCVGA